MIDFRPTQVRVDNNAIKQQNIGGRLLAGALAVALVAVLAQPGWAQIIQFVAMVSIVPLGLLLIRRRHQATEFEDLAWRLTPPATVAAAFGYLLNPGPGAAIAATPWLAVTAIVALGGLVRFIDRPWPVDHRLIETVAQGFLLVGGTWFWMSRAGLNPMSFGDSIVALTGIHFHYAGFAMPLVVSQIGYQQPSRSVNAAAIGVLVGIPFTAFGLTIGGLSEFIGGMTMALAGLWVAAILLRHARSEKGLPGFGLGFAAVCLVLGMILAGLYVTSLQFNQDWLNIERMVRTHGSINGFGFGLVALLSLAFGTPPTSEPLPPKRIAAGRASPKLEQWIDQSSALSYPEGILRLAKAPNHYRQDFWSRRLGEGQEVFVTASAAIDSWVGHRQGAGFSLIPERPELKAGTDVVVTIPLGPLNIYAPARVVWTVDDAQTYGFAYGTLKGHFSSGEESFLVTLDDEANVSIQITAVWQAAWWPLKIAGPVSRIIQRRAIEHWLDGVQNHCQE